MVKAQKEKQYQSAREQRANSHLRSGRVGADSHNLGSVQRRLPFRCCALTMVPFEDPVCNSDGILFERSALVAFLLRHKKDPVTGQPCGKKDLITLRMDKDDEGRWQCPVLTKPFHEHTKIVAVRDRDNGSAHVYSHEAYKELNLQSKNWTDLTTGKPFHPKKDVIVLNDPNNEAFQKLRDVSTFWHIRNARTVKANNAVNESNVRHSVTATRIMNRIQTDRATKANEQQNKRKIQDDSKPDVAKKFKIYAEDVTGVKYTSGKSSSSLTSTSMELQVSDEGREATHEEILQAQFRVMRERKKKGYVRVNTSMGEILIELHCDIAPRTCTNFLGLCEAKKYDGTVFHRLIRNFMIQGGKAKAGEKDVSLWGQPFEDEFDDRLKHAGGGILSMANAGPKTNQRQFFITFKSCPHLDRKHSVFGRVAKGMDVVKEMERQPTDKKDRPKEAITIVETEVLVNPAKEAEEVERVRLEALAEKRTKDAARKKSSALGRSTATAASSKTSSSSTSSVGKYLPRAPPAPRSTERIGEKKTRTENSDDNHDDGLSSLASKIKAPKKAPVKTSFGDFSGW